MNRPLAFGILLLSAGPLLGADVPELLRAGDALDQKLKTKEALSTYLAAEKAEPANAEVLHRIAKEYGLSMDDVSTKEDKKAFAEKALEYSKRAVTADPKNAMAHLALAISYGRLAPLLDNKTKIAYSKLVKEEADNALALDPSSGLTHHVLGKWNLELANLNPFLRAMASAMYGNLPAASNAAAVEHFKKAIAANPGGIASHVELGRTYAAMGDKVTARTELQKGLDLPAREKDDPIMKERARAALKDL